MTHLKGWTGGVAMACLIAVTAAVYLPGLSGGFVLDDYHNIVDNTVFKPDVWTTDTFIEAATSGSAGPLKRPVAMLSFAIDAWAHGLRAGPMKAVNLALHCLSGIVVFWIALQLLSSPSLKLNLGATTAGAVIAAGFWLLHPVQVSAVLYVVQRMAILATLFGALSIACYVRARSANTVRSRWAWLSAHWAALALGAFSKENALLVIPLIAAIEGCIFRLQLPDGSRPAWLRHYAHFLVSMCGIALGVLVVYSEHFLGSYAFRPFTLTERLLTEARALWYYSSLIAFPIPNRFTIYTDGFELSRNLITPLTTLSSVLGLALVGALAAWQSLRTASLWAFAILWFLIAHAMESGPIALELVFQHRNHLPSIGISIAVGGAFIAGNGQLFGYPARLICASALLLTLAGTTFVHADAWSDPIDHALISAAQHPESARAQYAAGTIHYAIIKEMDVARDPSALDRYISGAKAAEAHLSKAATLAPDAIAPLAQQIILFGEPDGTLMQDIIERLAAQTLRPEADRQVIRLLDCYRRGECRLDPQRLIDACRAAQTNTQASGRLQASFLLLEASIQAVELGNTETARKLVDKAVALRPNSKAIQLSSQRFYEQYNHEATEPPKPPLDNSGK